jgi:hypothetical protein
VKDQAGLSYSPGFGWRNQIDAVQHLPRWQGALQLPGSAGWARRELPNQSIAVTA